ncbi:MAG: divalent-cation tolerance protein CutA [Cyanobacteria bacterium J06626_23]
MTQYGIVLVTAGSDQEAQHLATALVSARLAACVSITPIRAIYRWQGNICNEAEYQLTIKTDLSLFDSLVERIQTLHSYDVPEILALPIGQGAETYLNWMGEQVRE